MFAWQFTITAYNPLARSVTGFIRVPVNMASYHVKGPSGKAVPSQVSSIAHLNSALVVDCMPLLTRWVDKAWASLHFLVIFWWVAIILEFFCWPRLFSEVAGFEHVSPLHFAVVSNLQ